MRDRWVSSLPAVLGRLAAIVLLGLLIGSGSEVQADHAGYALRFDGVSDFVRLAETANIMGLADWQNTKTVSLWVKPTGASFCTAPSVAACDAVFGDRPRWWGISRGVLNGSDRIWVWNYDGSLRMIPVEYTVGEWTHIAMVHAGGVLSAYKNGVLVGSVSSGATRQPNTGALPVLQVGGIINNATRNWTFEGEIDEVQIWSVARSVAELNQDMNEPLGGTELGLTAYYRMSDGAGTLLTDDSGHGWTGTLQDGLNAVPPDGPIQWVPSNAYGDSDGGGTPGNGSPVAVGQTMTAGEDEPAGITLTGFDPDGDPLTFQVTSQPLHGTLSGTAPDVVYSPSANYAGSDSFWFVVNDGAVSSAPASVTLTVTPVNDAPVAADDTAVTGVDSTVAIAVLANDSDVDSGDSLVVIDAGPGANGTVTFDSSTVTYAPDPGFTGTDTFSYTVADLSGGTATASITVSVSASTSPQEISVTDTPGFAHDLVVEDGYAYIADRSAGLQVFDVSNPASPVRVGSVPTVGAANGVFVAGGYAYVANGQNGLRVIDVADPARPREVSFWDTREFAQDVEVDGTLAYVADRWGGLSIIDVSNPVSPVEVGWHPTPDQAIDVAVAGHHVLVAAYGAGLRVVDVSDPANPVEVGAYFSPHFTYGVDVLDGIAYVAAGANDLRLVDISDPTLPRELGVAPTPGVARSVFVSSGRAYVADWESGVRIVDLSDPSNPTEIGYYDTAGRTRDVVAIGQYIYVADYDGGLRILIH